MNKLEKILKGMIVTIFAALAILLTVASYTATTEITGFEDLYFIDDSVLKNILCVVLCFAVFYGGYRLLDKMTLSACRRMVIVISVAVALFLTVWILLVRLQPISDQKVLIRIAQELIDGDFHAFLPGGYMEEYPFQNTMVLYLAALTLVFGPQTFIAAQLINIPFYFLGIYAVYRLLRFMGFGEKTALCAYLGMLLWFPFACYTTFIYGTIIGFSFAMVSLASAYRYFHSGQWKDMLISTLMMGLSVSFKSNYMIVMVALVLVMFFYVFHSRKAVSLLCIVAVTAGTLLLPQVFDLLMESRTHIKTSKGIPKVAWVAMSISDNDRYGWCEGYNDYVYKRNNCDYDATQKECIRKIQDRLVEMRNMPQKTIMIFKKKMMSIWNNPTFQGFGIMMERPTDGSPPSWMLDMVQDNEKGNRVALELLNIAQSVIWTGVLLYLLCRYRRLTIFELLFAIILIGVFLFHIFWEAKSQYTIYCFYLMIPYCVAGYSDACGILRRKILHRTD